MTKSEVELVKRRLEDYQTYNKLAKEAWGEIEKAKRRLSDMASVSSPSWDGEHIQNPKDKASSMNDIMSEQQVHEYNYRAYRRYQNRLKDFIFSNFSGETLAIFESHYLYGKTYQLMEMQYGRTSTGMRSIVDRALEKIDFHRASEIV